MLAHPLFQYPLRPQFQYEKAYALASLLRAMEFSDSDYIGEWAARMGCGYYAYAYEPSGWPLPYCVLYHPDGVIIGFLGLRNLLQALQLFENTRLTQYYACQGHIFHWVRQMHEATRAGIINLFNNAPNRENVVLCGHSAGGALAAVYKGWFHSTYPTVAVQAMTFGAPKPGDKEFCDSVGSRFWQIQTEEDVVPAFPYFTRTQLPFTNIPINIHYAESPGKVITLTAAGQEVARSSWFANPALFRLATNLLRDPTNPSGVAHKIDTYVQRLRNSGEQRLTRDVWSDRRMPLAILNECASAEVRCADKLTPTVRRPTTPVASPPAPSLPQVQTGPTTNGHPTAPVPIPADNTIVGRTDRVYVDAVVSSSPTRPRPRPIGGSDRRLCERLLYALDLFTRRDNLLYRNPRSPALSNGTPFLGPGDDSLFADVYELQMWLLEKMSLEFSYVPAL